MPALDAAIALAHVAEGSVLVAGDLDLDVAGFEDVLLHVHAGVPERGPGLLAGLVEGFFELLLLPHQAHALATTTSRGLQDHGVTDLLRLLLRHYKVRHQPFGARNTRHTGRDHGGFRRGLVAHRLDLLGQGADELDVMLLAQLAELGVLAQETVTRVDRIGVGDLGRRDDAHHVQVAVLARWWADAYGLVREAHVQALLVGGAVHGHRLDAHLPAGAYDA